MGVGKRDLEVQRRSQSDSIKTVSVQRPPVLAQTGGPQTADCFWTGAGLGGQPIPRAWDRPDYRTGQIDENQFGIPNED